MRHTCKDRDKEERDGFKNVSHRVPRATHPWIAASLNTENTEEKRKGIL
jgi:hypothetical protein